MNFQELSGKLQSKESELREYQQLWETEAAGHVLALEEAKRSWALEKSLLVKRAAEYTRRCCRNPCSETHTP